MSKRIPLAGAVLALACLLFSVQPGWATQNVPLSHGRYCGMNNSQTGQEPVSALDRACKEHDECANVAVPACDCHTRFIRAVAVVRDDGAESETMRKLAANIIAAISRVPCTGADDGEAERSPAGAEPAEPPVQPGTEPTRPGRDRES